ncbi:MAG: ArgE/DapE family deacylase, partial [Alphaproteobacteria bacterium]|nr:ArgE/DapE family deacylase [Alphaproteobacteria bacterium]
MDRAQHDAIRQAVDTAFEAQVATTADLVRYPSTRGQEATAQDRVAVLMRERGLAVDRWKIEVDDIAHLPGFSPVDV